jgi:hypothetical protein
MKAEDYLNNGKVHIWKGKYAIIKAKKTSPNAFANIIDKNEITVIVNQDKIDKESAIEIEKDWKILTFNMVLPFELVGFLAKISQALAEEKISIFTISAYSTDHILIKEQDLEKAKKRLLGLGLIMGE